MLRQDKAVETSLIRLVALKVRRMSEHGTGEAIAEGGKGSGGPGVLGETYDYGDMK